MNKREGENMGEEVHLEEKQDRDRVLRLSRLPPMAFQGKENQVLKGTPAQGHANGGSSNEDIVKQS